MAEVILGAIILGLLADRFLLVRQHRRDLEKSGELDSKVIDFAETATGQMAEQLSEQRTQVSEMANTVDTIHSRSARQLGEMAERIQHPEIHHPAVEVRDDLPSAPVYDDEYDLVGKILPEHNNGEPE